MCPKNSKTWQYNDLRARQNNFGRFGSRGNSKDQMGNQKENLKKKSQKEVLKINFQHYPSKFLLVMSQHYFLYPFIPIVVSHD